MLIAFSSAEKKSNLFGSFWEYKFHAYHVHSSFTTSLIFSQTACARCRNCVFTQIGSGDSGSCQQLTETLWNLCVSRWEALPVCGWCGYHMPRKQPRLSLNHPHLPHSTCLISGNLKGLTQAFTLRTTWHAMKLRWQWKQDTFRRNSKKNVPRKVFRYMVCGC